MVYILAIEPPLRHAQYYLGYCQDSGLTKRLQRHKTGSGATLTRAAIQAGRCLRLVAILPHADRSIERSLKNRKNTPRLVKSIMSNPKNWSIYHETNREV